MSSLRPDPAAARYNALLCVSEDGLCYQCCKLSLDMLTLVLRALRLLYDEGYVFRDHVGNIALKLLSTQSSQI